MQKWGDGIVDVVLLMINAHAHSSDCGSLGMQYSRCRKKPNAA